jgi:molybdopterin biosynthesis enzyme
VAICLPGNPVAHLAVFHLLVRPVLGKLAGATNPWPVFYEAPLLASLPGKPNPRHTFWPAVHGPDGLRPLRFLSSGDVLALAGVNAMISLEADAPPFIVGTRVPFLPLHPAL